MKEITNKKILNLITLCILIIVPFLKFFSMNLEMFELMNNYDFINSAIILWISVPFLIYIYIKDIIDKKRKLDIYDYLFYILIILGIISTIFSINKNIALFGKDFRHEGFLSVLSYYLLFINWKVNGTKDDIKKFLKLLVIIAVINSIYALFQMYTNFDFVLIYESWGKMASGLCGNPNFFGSLIVTVLSIVTCNFLIDKEKLSYKKVLLLMFLFVSLINSESTGPILTYIIFLIFLFVFLYVNKYKVLKRFLKLCIILIITYLTLMPINNNFVVNKDGMKMNKNETSVSSITDTVKSGGNGRLEIWKNSLEIVKDYPIVGVGFDNFYLAYPNPKIESGISLLITDNKLERKDSSYVLIYDNAHNVYLHTLVSTGVLGLIPYLLLCLLTFIKGLKFKSKLGLLLLSGFVAYSIQAFANISVIQVAPIYYIIIGLMLSIKEEPNKTSNI